MLTPLQKRLSLTGAARDASIAAVEQEMDESVRACSLFQFLFFQSIHMVEALEGSSVSGSDDEVVSTVSRALRCCHELLREGGRMAAIVLAGDVVGIQDSIRRFVRAVKEVLSAGKALANSEPTARSELMRHLRRIRDASTGVVQATPASTIGCDGDGAFASVMKVLVQVTRQLFDYVPTIASNSSADLRKKRAATKFVAQMLRRMAIEYYNPGELVVKKGERGKSMYFITSGEVEILLPSSSKKKSKDKDKGKDGEGSSGNPRLGVGSFFGEIALFIGKKRTASVKAITQVDVAVLTKDACDSILENFPDLYEDFKRLGEARLAGTLRRGSSKKSTAEVPTWFSDVSRRVASLTAKPVLKIYTPHRALILDSLFKTSDSEFRAKLVARPEETVGILASVCTREEMESLVVPLLRVYDADEALVTLLEFCITFEVERTPLDMAASLMRGSSFGPKVLTGLLSLVGDEYTESICRPGFEALLAHPELTALTDPLALEEMDKETFDKHVTTLISVLDAFVSGIFSEASISSCPRIIRIVCHILMISAEARFGQFETIVGGILFLRLICPSILNASERFGYDPSSPPARKVLILVSKALQNLSNRTEYPAIHRYSSDLNKWLAGKDVECRTYMNEIVDLEFTETTRATAVQSFVSSRSAELPLEVGCIVENIQQTSSPDWLHGRRGDHEGYIPTNHVSVTTYHRYSNAAEHHLCGGSVGVEEDLAMIRGVCGEKEREIYGFVEKL